MGRIPRPKQVGQRFCDLVVRAVDADELLSPAERKAVLDQARTADALLHRLMVGLHQGNAIVAEAVATVVVELGREIAPPQQPRHPLRLHKTCHHRGGTRRRHRRTR
ncbi:hypothetical protein BBK82_05080 [Lentzea guizhouensis]|uniref:Uncharacterized protein n=1 Tax=Lentzea guizhouensis TaxID=1586287 RepID=A0A1B2HCZ0_9PSEU|nr:hypothetical protein [Lentzea guizhouensis]ANZ35546.1 hypothetical protein BBK82_05080 [Lentzea guizhouensis]